MRVHVSIVDGKKKIMLRTEKKCLQIGLRRTTYSLLQEFCNVHDSIKITGQVQIKQIIMCVQVHDMIKLSEKSRGMIVAKFL